MSQRWPVPSDETVNEFEQHYDDNRRVLEQTRQALAEARAKIGDLEGDLERLRLSGEIPLEDDLTAARERRDSGWHWSDRPGWGEVGMRQRSRLSTRGYRSIGPMKTAFRDADTWPTGFGARPTPSPARRTIWWRKKSRKGGWRILAID